MSINQLIYEAKGRGWYHARRDRHYANGRTANGRPRQRNYQCLAGFTEEQKRERNLRQQKAWRDARRGTCRPARLLMSDLTPEERLVWRRCVKLRWWRKNRQKNKT